MSHHVENMINLKKSLERDVQAMQCVLERRKTELKNLEAFLLEFCEHNWVDDDIDITLEKSMRITYCDNCELQKSK